MSMQRSTGGRHVPLIEPPHHFSVSTMLSVVRRTASTTTGRLRNRFAASDSDRPPKYISGPSQHCSHRMFSVWQEQVHIALFLAFDWRFGAPVVRLPIVACERNCTFGPAIYPLLI